MNNMLVDQAPRGASSFLKSPVRLSTIAIAGLCLLLSIPVLTVFWSITNSSDGVWQHLVDTLLFDYVRDSALLMLGVGISVLVLGVVPAWLVTMTIFPGSRILEWALVLPLAIPAYIIA